MKLYFLLMKHNSLSAKLKKKQSMLYYAFLFGFYEEF